MPRQRGSTRSKAMIAVALGIAALAIVGTAVTNHLNPAREELQASLYARPSSAAERDTGNAPPPVASSAELTSQPTADAEQVTSSPQEAAEQKEIPEPRMKLRNNDVVMFFARAPSRIKASTVIRARQFNPLGQQVSADAEQALEDLVKSHSDKWGKFSDRYFAARRREVEHAKSVQALWFLEEALPTLKPEAVERAETRATLSWQKTHEGAPPTPGDDEWEMHRQRSMARTLMPLVGLYSTAQVGNKIAYVRHVAGLARGESSQEAKLDPELFFWKSEFFFKTITWALGNGLIDDVTAGKHVKRFHGLIDAHRKFWLAR